MGCWRSFRLFCIYQLLKKRLPSALSFLFSVPRWSLWTATLLLCIIFSTQDPPLMFGILEAFSCKPCFLNPLLFLWPSGSCFRSILWKAESIQSEIIPARSYRKCVSILIPIFFNPAVSFPVFTWVMCATSLSIRMSPVLSQRLQRQMGSAVSGLVRMLPSKVKCLCLIVHCFYTSSSFKGLSARISSEESLL